MTTGNASVLGERYELSELIGRGGMADVYRATDLVLARTVALKVLREHAEDGSRQARFRDEARVLASLSHPNLVSIWDAGFTEDRPYLVMELVEGTTLARCCAGAGMDPARVADVGTAVAGALAYAHARGVVHRDVKPANVLIGDDERTILSDFGIARLVSQTTRHTRTGTAIGSPAYLAPEQVRGERVETAADTYSLGLVLLEALTGRPAYAGPPTEAALARLTAPPAIDPSVPPRWADLIRAMTRPDPADRPTAAEVAAELRDVAGQGVEDESEATRLLTSPVVTADETHVVQRPGRRFRAWVGRPAAGPRSTTRGDRARIAVVSGLVLAGLALFVTAALSSEGPRTEPRDELPAGVPADLREPLAELHDAVHGEGK